jgi:hypothetical protein
MLQSLYGLAFIGYLLCIIAVDVELRDKVNTVAYSLSLWEQCGSYASAENVPVVLDQYGLVLLEPSGLAVWNAAWQMGTLLSLSPW